jgi:hypothetical protein
MRATIAVAALAVLTACKPDDVVKPQVTIPFITAVELESPTNIVVPGEFLQVEARAINVFGSEVPDTRFSWTTTNPDIATVDRGLVHALAPGNVAVLAVAERVTGRLAITVRVVPPVVHEIEPAVTAVAQPVVISIMGYGFYRGSVVRVNGRSMPTTYVTGRVLRAALSAADIPLSGEYIVTVYNAVAGAGRSNEVSFEVR